MKQFADKNNKILRFDKTCSTYKLLPPPSIEVQKDFYTLCYGTGDDFDDKDAIENWLAKIEGDTSKFIKSFYQFDEISDEDKLTFSRYMVISALRTEEFKDLAQNFIKLKINNNKEEKHALLLQEYNLPLAKQLAERNWLSVNSDKGWPFSDAMLCLVGSSKSCINSTGTDLSNSFLVIFVVSRYCALVMFPKDYKYGKIPEEFIKKTIIKSVFYQSSRYVYSNPEDWKDIWETIQKDT
jgi:hypothetical protein